MYEKFTYKNVDYLIDKENVELLFHFCINDRDTGYLDIKEPYFCIAGKHKYYYHSTYCRSFDSPYCPWCLIEVPIELSEQFSFSGPRSYKVICLECEKE